MQDNGSGIRRVMPSSAQSSVIPIRGNAKKYPWDTIAVGESFVVYYTDMKLTSLRPFANRMGKKHGKKFRVIDHGESVGYEVACISMTEEQASQTSSNVVEALGKVEAPKSALFEALDKMKEGGE